MTNKNKNFWTVLLFVTLGLTAILFGGIVLYHLVVQNDLTGKLAKMVIIWQGK